MVFKIICCGWNCAEFMEQTLRSIETQTCDDYRVMISYATKNTHDDGVLVINDWLNSHDHRWHAMIRHESIMDVQNRYEAAKGLDIKDDDIVITLDLDGDELAHPQVLDHLLEYYSDGTLLTYGNYVSKPFDGGCPPVLAYPEDVIANRSYRSFRNVYFNHLRTMKGLVFNAIPEEQFHFAEGTHRGEWYWKGNDVQWTFCGLELVGRRHKVIPEVLMYYNSINPNSNWRIAPNMTEECNADFFARPPLEELP